MLFSSRASRGFCAAFFLAAVFDHNPHLVAAKPSLPDALVDLAITKDSSILKTSHLTPDKPGYSLLLPAL